MHVYGGCVKDIACIALAMLSDVLSQLAVLVVIVSSALDEF